MRPAAKIPVYLYFWTLALFSCRFYVLTNEGGFFQAKGFAAEFDSLKPLPALHGSSEVTLEKSGSGVKT